MSRKIPQAFIDELVNRVDIVNIIEPFVQLRKAGRNYLGLCPFHQEKTPSFTVSPSKQFYHCFGCGVNGNSISFLMEYERMTFIEAVETLATHAGIPIPKTDSSPNTREHKGESLYEIMQQVTRCYQTQLQTHPEAKQAMAYLKTRGLTDEIIKNFNIGYAPSGWNNLLSKIGNQHKQTLIKAGMIIENPDKNSYDRFRRRIMFPIYDRRGRITAFGGRVLGDEDSPKYLNSPETPIFNKSNELYGLYQMQQTRRKFDRILIVEGYMDVLSLAQYGIHYAVATLGTATTPQHLQLLFRACHEIVFCFDGDRAGRAAAWRALETLLPIMRDEWQPKFMFLSDNEDPDTLIRKIGIDNFETLIQQAETLTHFFFTQLNKEIDLSQIDGRARLTSLALPYLQKMQNNVIKELLLEQLAKMAQMNIEKLYHHLPEKKPESVHTPTLQNSSQNTKSSPIRTAISLLIQFPNLAEQVEEDFSMLTISGSQLFITIVALLKENPTLSTGSILEHWRNKPEGKALMKLASYEHALPEESIIAEFRAILKKLKHQNTEIQIISLMNKAASTPLTHREKQELRRLLQEKQLY